MSERNPLILANLIRNWCDKEPDLEVLTFVEIDDRGKFRDETRTYRQLWDNGQRLAAWLPRGVQVKTPVDGWIAIPLCAPLRLKLNWFGGRSAAIRIAGAIIRASSSPMLPFSPACGFNPQTPIRGFSMPNHSRSAFGDVRASKTSSAEPGALHENSWV